jgi:hypothetical protein
MLGAAPGDGATPPQSSPARRQRHVARSNHPARISHSLCCRRAATTTRLSRLNCCSYATV